MVVAAGIDGYGRGAWVAVVLRDGGFSKAIVGPSLAVLLPRLRGLTVGIDIPIGLPDEGERRADQLARGRVGKRWPSVFMTPPRRLLEASTHEQAMAAAQAAGMKGLSRQAFAIGPRIFEAERAIRDGWAIGSQGRGA